MRGLSYTYFYNMIRVIVIVAVLALGVSGWWCTGHQLVAQVAYKDL